MTLYLKTLTLPFLHYLALILDNYMFSTVMVSCQLVWVLGPITLFSISTYLWALFTNLPITFTSEHGWKYPSLLSCLQQAEFSHLLLFLSALSQFSQIPRLKTWDTSLVLPSLTPFLISECSWTDLFPLFPPGQAGSAEVFSTDSYSLLESGAVIVSTKNHLYHLASYSKSIKVKNYLSLSCFQDPFHVFLLIPLVFLLIS